MAKGRKRKCVLCGLPIDDNNESIPYKNRYAHITCFRAAAKAIHVDKEEQVQKKAEEKKTRAKPKAQVELKDGLTDEEYIQKNLYYDYLKKNIGVSELPVKVYALTENYIKKYAFTFQGLYATLTYMRNILEKDFGEDIVGLIPYYYTEAQAHYKAVKGVEDRNKDVNTKGMYKHKTVYIDTKQKKIKQIDITSIGGDANV